MSRMHHHREGYPFGSLVDFATDSSGRKSLTWVILSNARVTIFGDVLPLPADQQVSIKLYKFYCQKISFLM